MEEVERGGVSDGRREGEEGRPAGEAMVVEGDRDASQLHMTRKPSHGRRTGTRTERVRCGARCMTMHDDEAVERRKRHDYFRVKSTKVVKFSGFLSSHDFTRFHLMTCRPSRFTFVHNTISLDSTLVRSHWG